MDRCTGQQIHLANDSSQSSQVIGISVNKFDEGHSAYGSSHILGHPRNCRPTFGHILGISNRLGRQAEELRQFLSDNHRHAKETSIALSGSFFRYFLSKMMLPLNHSYRRNYCADRPDRLNPSGNIPRLMRLIVHEECGTNDERDKAERPLPFVLLHTTPEKFREILA